jgi:hypothetical protein
MSVVFTCPNCSHKIPADDAGPGRNVKCPACGADVTAPLLGPGTEPPLTGTAPGGSAAPSAAESATKRVRFPSLGILFGGVLQVLLGGFGFIMNAGSSERSGDRQALLLLGSLAFALVGVVTMAGAHSMGKLRSLAFARTVAIMAVIPCISPMFYISLPAGIWALVVLSKPEVKSQFGR